MQIFHQILDYVLLALGLGFVIFFHELGHFLAAKYSDVKVEQFAVGFGPAILAWRKGIGFRSGTTAPDFQKRIEGQLESEQTTTEVKEQDSFKEKIAPTPEVEAAIARKLGLGETEYRLNWIPLGGYVKMLGQDDLRPGATNEDPRSYNSKPIRSRMLIVSAGVIMNVILAAIAFAIVFRLGLPVPPAIVGGVVSHSPAMNATRADHTRVGLQPFDKIISFNGYSTIGDFSKLKLYTALSHDGANVPVVVQHRDGAVETLYLEPQHAVGDRKGLLLIGVKSASQLAGFDVQPDEPWDEAKLRASLAADSFVVKPGDVITQINGQNVSIDESWKLDDAMAASDGKPIELTIKSANGKISNSSISPHFDSPHSEQSFQKDPLSFLGIVPRVRVGQIGSDSPVLNKLKPGDLIVGLSLNNGDHLDKPREIQDRLSAAGDAKAAVTLSVLSAGDVQPHEVGNVIPNGKKDLGMELGVDEQHLVVGETLAGSPADNKIPSGATLTDINGTAVSNWFQVRRMIADAKPGDTLVIGYTGPKVDDGRKTVNIPVSAQDITSAQTISLTNDLLLRAMSSPLKTTNPLVAAQWAVVETRDMIFSFYVTLQRMITHDVSPSNLMGPFGMATAGAQVARQGIAPLLWFLGLISANLAVVNFLPFPIVDGGLFTLLILEKIQGKPLSQDVQKIIQIAGLALILGVFLFVTYQDIVRFAGT